jgi:hypothetical protein
LVVLGLLLSYLDDVLRGRLPSGGRLGYLLALLRGSRILGMLLGLAWTSTLIVSALTHADTMMEDRR